MMHPTQVGQQFISVMTSTEPHLIANVIEQAQKASSKIASYVSLVQQMQDAGTSFLVAHRTDVDRSTPEAVGVVGYRWDQHDVVIELIIFNEHCDTTAVLRRLLQSTESISLALGAKAVRVDGVGIVHGGTLANLGYGLDPLRQQWRKQLDRWL
jgi:hypothetical protein